MTVPERLTALRTEMKKHGIDAWLVPTDDFHSSEYVGNYFKCREFITGFTGSAGTALILKDSAYLWTDGRYFLQAADQLKDSGVTLMRMGDEGVPTTEEFIGSHLTQGQTLGFDGRCMTAGKGSRLAGIAKKNGASVSSDLDLVGAIWEDRPVLSCRPVWELDTKWTGKSRADKIADLREAMKSHKADYHVLTSLDDIAWLLNLRGDDVACNPVFLAYVAVTPQEVLLFTQAEAFADGADPAAVHGVCGSALVRELEKDHVRLVPYNDLYSWMKSIPEKSTLLFDTSTVNYTVWSSVPKGVRVVDTTNPTLLPKAIRTPVEMDHTREAHLKDGVAVTKFMYWLKQQMAHYDPAHPVTELSACDRLLKFRQEQEHFLGISFDTIAGFGSHGAIVHYEPTPETDIPLEPRSFLLVDSGGQYLEGTTDITRTFACGILTQEEKEMYTRVLRGNLNLGAAKFHYGCTGTAIDYLARSPLWEAGLDYNHGTGHGVGYLLNVHEGPNSVNYTWRPGRRTPCVFEEGMVTSDEPGIYLTGKFGVRCENLMLCRKAEKNEYGQFMEFEILTLVPWDLDAVVPEMLSEREKEILNNYHRRVYAEVSPYLSEKERTWLRHATREI